MQNSLRPRIVVMCINEPWPTRAGGTLRDWQNINALAKFADVFVFFFHGSDEETPSKGPNCVSYWGSVYELARVEKRLVPKLFDRLRESRLSFFSAHWSEYLWSNEICNAISAFIAANQIDICVLEDQALWKYSQRIESQCSVIVDFHNVQSDVELQLLSAIPRSQVWSRFQGRLSCFYMRRAEAALKHHYRFVCSSVDKEKIIINMAGQDRTWIVNNTVDCSLAERNSFEGVFGDSNGYDDVRIFFPGALSYQPNQIAIERLVDTVFPAVRQQHVSSSLWLAGKEPSEHLTESLADKEGVQLFANVQDMTSLFRRATVMSVPLTQGGGTRFKILEAFLYGVPVVTTSRGCEGLEISSGQHAIIEDDVELHAQHILHLHRDLEFRTRICTNARNLLSQRYSFSTSYEQIRYAVECIQSREDWSKNIGLKRRRAVD